MARLLGSGSRWRTIFTCLFLLAFLGMIVAAAWSTWRYHNIADDESHASTIIRSLATAEMEYRMKDLDGNKVHDFWTADVAGLHGLGLIPREVAEADARPLNPLVAKPVPYRGYYFIAMGADESETPIENLRQDTDKKSGHVHHLTKFGFTAYPTEYGVTGRITVIVNQNNTMFRRHHFGNLMDYWPSDEGLRHDWGLGD